MPGYPPRSKNALLPSTSSNQLKKLLSTTVSQSHLANRDKPAAMSANNPAIFRPLRIGEVDPPTYQNSHSHVNKKWLFENSATPQPLLRDEVKSEGYYLRNRAQLRLPKRFREQASRHDGISKADRHQNAASKKAQNNEQPRPYLHLHNRSAMGPLQQQRLRHIAKKAIAYMQDHSIQMPQENRFGGLPIGTQLYSWVKVEGA